MRRRARVAAGGIWLLAAALAGCDKNGPTSPDSPVISNLSTALAGGCGRSQLAELAQRVEFDYADPNGDVRGGHVEVRARSQKADPETFNVTVPSDAASISGTTTGHITVSVCTGVIAFEGDRVRVRLFDAANNASNEAEVKL
jgi:hypothetical protein